LASLIMLLSWACLIALILAACAADLRTRRIPNALAVGGLLVGLGLQASAPQGGGLFAGHQPGGLGLSAAAQAAAVMLVLTFVAWRFRLFGAGDAKLLIAVSSFFGPADVLPLCLATLIAGGVQALVTVHLTSNILAGGRLAALPALARLPYSVAIGSASLVVAAAAAFGLWH
jgi:prepilin peptidase CpaA